MIGMNDDQPVFVISVAAELSHMHPQTLRMYERKGLVVPKRTTGKSRLYSKSDIEKLKNIQYLTQEIGINLAGVKQIIELKNQLEEAEENLRAAQAEMEKVKQKAKTEMTNILMKNTPQLVRRGETGVVPFDLDWQIKFVKAVFGEDKGADHDKR